jgi:hypothetical protein
MNKKAFTLIELVVWITISMILMVSVGIFVNNWMANIITQQKVIENTTNLTEFTSNIHTAINLMSSWTFQPQETSSWIIFKRGKNLWEWWFSYVWEMNSIEDADWNWIYCLSWSEDTKTKHIVLKNFIPFEEEGEDIFDDYDQILTWSSLWYISEQKNHVIKNSAWDIIIWKWIFWDKFEEWANWTDIYLNSPTWLTKDIPNNILFISDTLNNRILYYDITTNIIKILLDESDWLNEPTWLYYRSSEKALYIANSWNWEILKYSSKSDTDKKINIDFNIDENINNIKNFEIEFFPWITNIIEPNNITDFNITWISTSTDYFTWSTNKITYWLSDFSNSLNEWNKICSSNYTKYSIEWNDIIKRTINDCLSWSWTEFKHYDNNFQDFISWNNIKISTTNDVNWTDFSNYWNYYIKLSLVWDTTYSKYFPYFTKSDDNILTPNDNTLEVIEPWLNYPTWLWWNWTIQHNEFWNHTFNSSIFQEHSSDIILESPINYLNTTIDNWLVTLFLKYYKKYNCYNLDDKTEKTYLFNKNIN